MNPGKGSFVLAFALVASLVSVDGASAQRYLVHTYSENDGLPSSTIHDIVQDPSGRIWLATRAGIAAYDGVDWKASTTADALPDANQAALALDEEGTIWSVSSYGIEVSCYAAGSWTTLAERPVGLEGRAQALAATRHGGKTRVAVTTAKGLGVWDGKSWIVPLSGVDVHGVVAWDGRVYVATEMGLALYEDEISFPDLPGLRDRPGRALLGLGLERPSNPSSPPRLWLLGEGWLASLTGERFTVISDDARIPAPHPSSSVKIAGDGTGGAFYGNPSDVFYLDARGNQEVLDASSGLIARGTSGLLNDREGNVWIASLRGLSKIVSRRFANWDSEQGLLEDEVTAILERRRGGFVLGHVTGLSWIGADGRVETRSLYDPAVERAGKLRVLELAEDDQGGLWIAASGLGLGRLAPGDGTQGKIRWYSGEDFDLTSSVLVDREGTVWAVTLRGLLRRAGDRFVPVEDGPSESLRRLYQGDSGTIYVAASRTGLHILRDGRWRHALSGDGRGDNVFAVLEDPDGEVWVGTSRGLYRLQEDRLVYQDVPALARPIYFLLRDREAGLWIGTDNGVLRLTDDRLRHFTIRDGLAGRETNRAAGLLDAEGRIWIGTDSGLSVYRRSFDHRPPVPPRVELVSVDADGEVFPLGEPIHLGHDTDDLTFRFRALSFVDEHRLTYRSWLEGFDEDYLPEYPSPTQSIRYTNLPSGTYRFHLRAKSAEGVWSEPVSSAPITIALPWWRKPTFFTASAAVVAGLYFLLQRLYDQWRYSRRLESEVRRRTSELLDEKERLAVTLDSIADAVVTTAADGTILLINPAAEQLTGVRAPEAVGRKLAEVLSLRRDGELVDAAAEVIASGQARILGESLRTCRRGGDEYLVELSGGPLRHEGEIVGVVLAFRDVTERRRLEREALKAQQLEALGLLAGGIAHDFNNVLTGILGNLELVALTLQGSNPETAKRISQAKSAALRARDLTSQLSTFAQGGAPIRETAELAPLVANAAAYSLSCSPVRCSVDLPLDLWLVEVDTGQVQQAVGSLLLHAARSTPNGGTVEVRAGNVVLRPQVDSPLAPGRYVLLEIEDHGPGLPPESLETIFDPYAGAGCEGLGLGLATAYSIVRRHGGRLRMSSEVGRGSVFHVELPASHVVRPPPRTEPQELAHGSGRILVMDDEEVVRLVTQQMLSQLGYEPECTSEGREAIDRYARAREHGEKFDVVILDLTIRDGMGGRETIAELQRIDPEVVAVVCSGYSKDPIMSRYREHGFRAVLPKPFQIGDLGRVLHEVLAGGEGSPPTQGSALDGR